MPFRTRVRSDDCSDVILSYWQGWVDGCVEKDGISEEDFNVIKLRGNYDPGSSSEAITIKGKLWFGKYVIGKLERGLVGSEGRGD